ncbi:hypothetical protein EV182_004720 [Spiromyces aspiralis]|uniref:Uncharacterized protein n=1 Tax=Spiromyces aspiralis TaxID=68401 RepID=A0ACC1HIH0_9FUNG|nr:hypothetical protein EV182_004720 [Spiromyces aspiralis]
MLVARDHESDNSTATKHHIRSAGVTAVPSEDRQQQRVTHPSGGVMASIQQGAGVIAPSKDRDGRYDRRFPHQYEAAESKAQEETVMVWPSALEYHTLAPTSTELN